MTIEMEKIRRYINHEAPIGNYYTTLFWKRSPKSREGGKIYNMKIVPIFKKCFQIRDRYTRVKTYSLLKRLINRPQIFTKQINTHEPL